MTVNKLSLGCPQAGSGVRDAYTGPFSGTPRFCYYETFTFASGHKNLVWKGYDRSKVSRNFSLQACWKNKGMNFYHI